MRLMVTSGCCGGDGFGSPFPLRVKTVRTVGHKQRSTNLHHPLPLKHLNLGVDNELLLGLPRIVTSSPPPTSPHRYLLTLSGERRDQVASSLAALASALQAGAAAAA